MKRQHGKCYLFTALALLVIANLACSETPTPESPTNRPVPTTVPTQNKSSDLALYPTWYVSGAQQVNVRGCGSADCPILTTANYGQALAVVSTQNGWHEIRLPDGTKGYVASYLTSQAVPVAAAPTLPQQAPAQSDMLSEAQKIAKRKFTGVENVRLFNDSLGAVIIVEYNISELADRNFTDWNIVEAICEFRKEGFTSYGFRIAGKIQVVNSYGETSTVNGLVVVVNPATANRINCDNTVEINLPAIADQYDAHPAFD